MKITVKSDKEQLIEIKKSKFIGHIFPIKTQEEAKELIKEVNKIHNKATHNCYAYIVEGLEKSNDDGEPGGTAGKPILECIKNNNLEDVLVVVTRYFGGIKLGANGLVRAYNDAASEAIHSADKIMIKSLPIYNYEFDYSLINIMEKYLSDKDIRVIDKIYDLKVNYILAINEDFNDDLFNYTNGKIKIDFVENKEFEFKL